MAIDYKHLKEGTEVTSTSVNSRFESAMGVSTGVNKVSVEDLSPGALRVNHLPSMVGPSGRTAESMDSYFTKNNYNEFGSLWFTAVGPDTAALEFIQVVYLDDFEFKLAVDTYNLHAIIVLANLNIHRFSAGDSPTDSLCMRVFVQVEDINGVTKDILRSTRALSGQLTIDYSGFRMPADHYTNQDIAIRTVILEDDVVGLDKIKVIRLMGQLAAGELLYDKGTITAIPIHAKVL